MLNVKRNKIEMRCAQMKYIGNNSFKIRQLLRILLIGIGISFIYIGANRGEVSAVFDKAIRLCLECVGIG